jgi:hypothetical protein
MACKKYVHGLKAEEETYTLNYILLCIKVLYKDIQFGLSTVFIIKKYLFSLMRFTNTCNSHMVQRYWKKALIWEANFRRLTDWLSVVLHLVREPFTGMETSPL